MGKRLFFGSCLLFIVIILGILGWTYTRVIGNGDINPSQKMLQDMYNKK